MKHGSATKKAAEMDSLQAYASSYEFRKVSPGCLWCLFDRHEARGVTRLDGARGKKQVWRPRVRTWAPPEQMYCIEKNTCDNLWDFRSPPQWFGAQVNVLPLPPSLRPYLKRNARAFEACLWRFVCCSLAALMSLSCNVDCCHDSSGHLALVFTASVERTATLLPAITCTWCCSLFLQMVTAVLCWLKPSVLGSPHRFLVLQCLKRYICAT